MRQILFLLFISIILGTGCSPKYTQFLHRYQFESPTGEPMYADLAYWAAHPFKWDPSDSLPAPLRNEINDSLADVFFIHPTTFTAKEYGDIANAKIDDKNLNAKTDYTSILFQASVFNQHCRVFAPRYRQAHLFNFYKKDSASAAAALNIAYTDIKKAFTYYIKHWNKGRPFFIAGHSQGAYLAERLLKDFFENDSSKLMAPTTKNNLIAAYILGWPVPKDYFKQLTPCTDSTQTGCIISWRTYRTGYLPPFLRTGNNKTDHLFQQKTVIVTNPLSWQTNAKNISKVYNKGSVLKNFNKIYRHTTNAKVENGLLYVDKPKFPWSFLYFTKVYHIADINLFYINIRENVECRIRSFKKKNVIE
ncbi:MAG: DUF3089 domain-containing protein [Chitinophagaceae bacterium]|nr:DUF3089 domain-containing protein [Chitinophagaceae bacterium]MCB0740805.1 DUF3089 domain-containing protein [Chitinophagaceae bacterium]HQU55788.1 DUF3089 domain-containing protein [Chitinophagaceae bacterium]